MWMAVVVAYFGVETERNTVRTAYIMIQFRNKDHRNNTG